MNLDQVLQNTNLSGLFGTGVAVAKELPLEAILDSPEPYLGFDVIIGEQFTERGPKENFMRLSKLLETARRVRTIDEQEHTIEELEDVCRELVEVLKNI